MSVLPVVVRVQWRCPMTSYRAQTHIEEHFLKYGEDKDGS
jgi:hypothetical protein